MTALVIAEHDNASIKGATLNTVTAAWLAAATHVLVAGEGAAAAAQAAAQIAGVAKVIHADGASFATAWPRTSPPGAGHRRQLQPHPVPATAGGKNVARAWRQARRGADQRHHQGRQRRHLRAPHLRRQRHRHRAAATPSKVITVRTTGFDPAAPRAAAPLSKAWPLRADSGKSSLWAARSPRATALN